MNIDTASFSTFNTQGSAPVQGLSSNDHGEPPEDAGQQQDLAEIAEMAVMKRKEAEALEAQQRSLSGGFSAVA